MLFPLKSFLWTLFYVSFNYWLIHQRPNSFSNISLIEFVTNKYNTLNLSKRKRKSHIISNVHYNEYQNLKVYYRKQILLVFPSFDNEHIFKGDHSTWHEAYNMHETKIKIIRTHTHTSNFNNNNAYTMNLGKHKLTSF